MTDSAGGVVNRYDYSGFGEKWTPGTSTTVDNRFTYTGRAKNPVSGTQYSRYRTYDSSLGRFLHRDPIGYAGGLTCMGMLGVILYFGATLLVLILAFLLKLC